MPKRSRSGVVSRPGARRRADERERRQVERHDARAGALADGDRQLTVLHRRVEGLLQRARQAVDLVDEEDRARLQRGQEGGDVALALERRAGRLHERHAQLGGDDLRERGLAEPGRAGQQHVVERVAARGAPPAIETASCSRTDAWPTKSSSRRGRSERSSSSSGSTSGVWIRLPPAPELTSARSAARGRSAPRASRRRAPSSSWSASCAL